MKDAVYFKILQRRHRYRNPNADTSIPEGFDYTAEEYESARQYVAGLDKAKISYCYPGHVCYPVVFTKMQEPPLFLEYIGDPFWMSRPMMSVVGAREIEDSTERWMNFHLSEFLKQEPDVCVVSGGARGVDQTAHVVALKERNPTIIVLPTGLNQLYPAELKQFRKLNAKAPLTFLSEFENHQQIQRAHFYFRNRLIAALGEFTLVTQATLKSGSMLTVHHCLQNGKPVVSVPAHPEMAGFGGNIKLLQEGAYIISSFNDLLDFWRAESRSNQTKVLFP
ncbi:MAG: Smf family processing protein [Pseudobdellovibrio sp.]|jgi:DNA processing protein|nr:Smf family processing protein [Pseudobdellovibrio sp.]